MKIKFYIRDFNQTDENNYNFFYQGYTSNGSWTTNIRGAMIFDSEQEAVWKIEELSKRRRWRI